MGEAERQHLVERAGDLRRRISAIFADARAWNTAHPDEPPIDPDPQEELRQWDRALGRMLRNEERIARRKHDHG